MSRVPFPGKPGKFRRKDEALPTSGLAVKPDKFVSFERTRLFIQDFYDTVGHSDDEDELHGFSPREVDRARTKMNIVNSQLDSIRNELSSAIEFHFEEKYKSVLPSKANNIRNLKSTNSHVTPDKSKMTSHRKLTYDSAKRKSLPAATAAASFPKPSPAAAVRNNKHRQSLGAGRRRSSAATAVAPTSSTTTPAATGGMKTRRAQIQIPSWRPADADRHYPAADWRSLPGCLEDLSDEAYLRRHEKAEEEEQVLWEKWQTLRKSTGASIRGRSKSRRWREVVLQPQTPASSVLLPGSSPFTTGSTPLSSAIAVPAGRRDRRLSSLQSEDSFSSGRLSPRTGSLQEIIVVSSSTPVPPGGATAPPTPVPEDHHQTMTDKSAGIGPAGDCNTAATPTFTVQEEALQHNSPHHNHGASLLMTAATAASRFSGSAARGGRRNSGNRPNNIAILSDTDPITSTPDQKQFFDLSADLMPLSPPLSPASLSPPASVATTSTPTSRNLRHRPSQNADIVDGGGSYILREEVTSPTTPTPPRMSLRSSEVINSVSNTSDLLLATTTSPVAVAVGGGKASARKTPTTKSSSSKPGNNGGVSKSFTASMVLHNTLYDDDDGEMGAGGGRSINLRSTPRRPVGASPLSSPYRTARKHPSTASTITAKTPTKRQTANIKNSPRKQPRTSHHPPQHVNSSLDRTPVLLSSSKKSSKSRRTSLTAGNKRLLTSRNILSSLTSPRRRPPQTSATTQGGSAAGTNSPPPARKRASLPTAAELRRELYPLRSQSPSRRTRAGAARRQRHRKM